VGVAFEVALAVACIPLGREGEVLVLVELLYEVFAVTFWFCLMKNYSHFKKKKKKN
jgi:hypothetical protein